MPGQLAAFFLTELFNSREDGVQSETNTWDEVSLDVASEKLRALTHAGDSRA
jgi:hypothetical protein